MLARGLRGVCMKFHDGNQVLDNIPSHCLIRSGISSIAKGYSYKFLHTKLWIFKMWNIPVATGELGQTQQHNQNACRVSLEDYSSRFSYKTRVKLFAASCWGGICRECSCCSPEKRADERRADGLKSWGSSTWIDQNIWIIFGGKCFSLPEIYRISVEIRVIVDAEKNTWRVHGIVHTV